MRSEFLSDEKVAAKSGIFYSKNPSGVVGMFRGKEVFRYKTVEELIEVHIKAMNALEEKQESELEKNYTL